MRQSWKLQLQARAKNVDLRLKATKVFANLFPCSIRLKLSPVLIEFKCKHKNNAGALKQRFLRLIKFHRIFGRVHSIKKCTTLVTRRTWKSRLFRCCLLTKTKGCFHGCRNHPAVSDFSPMWKSTSGDAQTETLFLGSAFFARVLSRVKRKNNSRSEQMKLMVALVLLAMLSYRILQHLINARMYAEACFSLIKITSWKLFESLHDSCIMVFTSLNR